MGYRIGTRINLDVLNAESQVFAVERDLAKTRVDALMQWVRLLAAAGELQESTIAQIAAQMEKTPFAVPSDDVTDTGHRAQCATPALRNAPRLGTLGVTGRAALVKRDMRGV
ncbi:hypothetical protein [Hydrogenophaga sp.]|uniref:hypothetical protein n=1 Tax=Hydrogenophaga sp. TaxID=1904254 RepID=UPI0035AFC28E